MATDGSESSYTAAAGGEGAAGAAGAVEAAGAEPGRVLHARSFKLRFASHREQGRSYVSLVKPLGLPATVTGKFYSEERATSVDEDASRRALQRIEDMFSLGPRELHAAPVTSSQVYGWFAAAGALEPAARADRRLQHHIRDSAWLKARLCVLAADDRLKQR